MIQYDPKACTQRTIMQALGVRRLELAGGQGAAGSEAEEPSTPRRPYAACEVSHVVTGRARLVIPILRAQSSHASALAYFLSEQPDIQHVRLSRMSESIIIRYDPDVWDVDSIVTLVKAYDPDRAALDRWATAEYEPPVNNVLQIKIHKLEVALAASRLRL